MAFYDRVVFEGYEISERHRGFSHSFLGLATMTVVTAVSLLPVLYVLELLWVVGVVMFFGGYLGGAILHLVEDSCTKTGIQWNFPFSDWKVTGQLTTTARPEDVRYQQGFLTVIGVCVGGAFFVPMVADQYPAWMFSAAGLLVAVLLWVGFASVVAKCTVTV